MTFIKYRFSLDNNTVRALHNLKPPFGFDGFGEYVYYTRYSRAMLDSKGKQVGQESWADTVIRVVEGVFSIRKDWYLRNYIPWDDGEWQEYARKFAYSMFKMHWLPPGRGLWAMGTPFVNERGALALYNCGFTVIGENMANDLHWAMDALMCGVGVGFLPQENGLKAKRPTGTYDHAIPDSREGWINSLRALIQAWLNGTERPIFDYSKVRPAGLPIKGFGGVASGPEPLAYLHKQVDLFFERFALDSNEIRLKADIANAIGCCVVAGNVRRSAEILLGRMDDATFMDLKDYSKYPERADIGWMSNNSVLLSSDADFERMGEIAKRVIQNGEPGYLNMRNLPKGRIGKNDALKPDRAIGINPCGEIPLEDKEVCNVAETCPTQCPTEEDWLEACEHATFYTTTVALLPTHRSETNKVVARNRRVGISIIDVSGWKHEIGVAGVTRLMRAGYSRIREYNAHLSAEAGVPEAIRVTTIKPGGTTPKLVGKTSGIGHPTFKHTLRRVRINKSSPVFKVLVDSGFPYEDCVLQPHFTAIFAYPILQGPALEADKISLWEQAANLALAQREWSDNAVSNTLYFKPRWVLVKKFTCSITPKAGEKVIERDGEYHLYKYNANHEEHHIEPVLAFLAPQTKSLTLLPHTGEGVYLQMPESCLTEAEYEELKARTPTVDWSKLNNSDGEDTRYCEGDRCNA